MTEQQMTDRLTRLETRDEETRARVLELRELLRDGMDKIGGEIRDMRIAHAAEHAELSADIRSLQLSRASLKAVLATIGTGSSVVGAGVVLALQHFIGR
ncbi:MAG TPA: hypothetical protein VNE67_09095 [Acetobacteraceae bacterium]|nr:hypothetical protein [Acetobacteraceae bacterium]